MTLDSRPFAQDGILGWRPRVFNGTDEEKSFRIFLLCF
jgi:hypothetical protein